MYTLGSWPAGSRGVGRGGAMVRVCRPPCPRLVTWAPIWDQPGPQAALGAGVVEPRPQPQPHPRGWVGGGGGLSGVQGGGSGRKGKHQLAFLLSWQAPPGAVRLIGVPELDQLLGSLRQVLHSSVPHFPLCWVRIESYLPHPSQTGLRVGSCWV